MAYFVVAATVFSVAALLFWRAYLQDCDIHRRLLVGRGEAVLGALESGVRAHRQVGNWFRENIGEVLEETVAIPGIRGLAIVANSGEEIDRGGVLPEGYKPIITPQEMTSGVLISRRVRLLDEVSSGAETSRWRGRGRRASEEVAISVLLREPVWLVAFLDRSEYAAAIARSRIHLAVWVVITAVAVFLGFAVLMLAHRQSRLATQLTLAREREGRMEEMARLGAGLAHETKNPLGLVRGIAQSWAGGCATADEMRREARLVIDEADRVVSRINSFLVYARQPAPILCPTPLNSLLNDTVTLFRDETLAKGVVLSVETRPIVVLTDQGMLKQIVVNLIANALAACGSGDRVVVRQCDSSDGTVGIEVADTGDGIAAEDLSEVTKPYFSRRPGGTGLGLSIVSQIVNAHGWTLNILPGSGGGTTVRVGAVKVVN
ncbi:MAG: ATP-binding protein [Candidatus Sumerlaeota bacterium]|nr:ATP-binding protein [Candidatus Sumerlaeota bacterium]